MHTFLERFDLRVSLVYGFIATLWIVLSDSLLTLIFAGTPSLLAVVGALKGLGFVGVTMLALFAVLRIEFRKRERIERTLKNDITEHTQTLEALRQSESRFATLFQMSPAPTGISRLEDGHIVDVNDAFVKLLGYECAELFGHTALELGLWVYPQGRPDFVEAISEKGSVYNLELQGRTKSGAAISLLGSARMIDLGDVPYIVSLFYDITERKQMEDQIRYQALLLANASDAIISTDMSFKVRTWNLAAERIYGWKADEVMGKPIQEVILGEYLDTTEKEALHQLQTAGVWHGETSHRRKDHSQVYLIASTSYVADGAGKRVGVVSVNKDISERKHAEDELTRNQNDLEQLVEQRTAELKRAKTRLEATLNNTTDGIVLAYPDRGVDQSNAMFNTLFACEPDHFCNQSLLMLVNPDDRDRLAALIQTVTADGVNRQGEFQALRADNTWFEARIGLGSIQDGDAIGAGLVCSIQDISELKQRERLLRYHASLQENVSDAVIATDLKFRIQSWNPAAEQIYGWRAEEVLGKLIGEILQTEFASDESGERVQRDFLEKGAWSDEVVQYHKEGHTLQILSSTVLFKDENGQPFGLVAVNHDITERKRTAEALALSEHRFSLLVNGISDYAIYMLDPAGNIISWNPGAQRIKGYSADEILGQHFSRFYTPEDLAQREPEKVLRIAETEGHYIGEGWIVRKDGSKFWAEMVVTALRDSENHLICFTKITRDLTEQKLTEEGLQQALAKEKELNELKSRFVSMVAHDFRSPLASIQSSSDLLNNYSGRMTDEKKQHHFKTISSQIKNLTGILEDTLTISKTEAVGLSLNLTPTDLVPFCQSIIDDMQLIDATRPIRFVVHGEIGTIEIDRDHLRRALVNLLSNAAKYSPEGLVIEFSLSGENEQVVIRIQDQGIGIPEADLSHLFEVFHRAGNVGDIPGTGLGLVIVKRAVEAHGGSITVESQVGLGTTFILSLPVIQAKSTQ